MTYDNYSADPLLCVTYKILANILYVKLIPNPEEILENTKEAFNGEEANVDLFFTMRQYWENVGNKM
jgi:hypothetical protein